MTVAGQVDEGAVVLVEKDLLAVEFRIVHLGRVNVQNAAHGLGHLGIMGRLIQPGVPLKDVEQGVHGALRHHAVLGQLLIGDGGEIPAERLQIAALVSTFFLNEAEQPVS